MNTKTLTRDYSLVGKETPIAIKKGLADAEWYQSPVPKEKMRQLLQRRDGPAIRDTILWFALIFGSGFLVYLWWGAWYFIFPYLVYSVLYASTSDSRWHESSHGTAFKTDWMNNALYEVASFMVFRQSTVWRWSHARHHSDTIIRGRDPEISVKRPPKSIQFVKTFLGLGGGIPELKRMFLHASGTIDPEVTTYVPESEHGKVILKARIYLAIYAFVIVLSIVNQSVLPLMFVGFPLIFGNWLMPIYGITQHAGLQENVLDHRLNCRTVYMNRIHRFLYWNMNYHVEHHMYPLVPYHALPQLHEIIKEDCPTPYPSIWNAYKEIIPAIRKQMKDTGYFVDRKLPDGAGRLEDQLKKANPQAEAKIINDKIEVCPVMDLPKGEVIRFDFEHHTFAVYRTKFDNYYASEGMCSHGNAHLANGVVIGEMIECAKHNGRFNLKDGSPKRMPVCAGIKTFKVEVKNEKVCLDLEEVRSKLNSGTWITSKVRSNKNVGTFIKELELEWPEKEFSFLPGQYIHLKIPPHSIQFADFDIEEQYKMKWEQQRLFDLWSKNELFLTRNYSLANNPSSSDALKFNIRIALPPQNEAVSAGVGSSYVFALNPGDAVDIDGPFGDFLIKETQKEMVYLGGGAGMAPIRSHISHLFETQKTKRKVSFWYGARAKNDLFYSDYFKQLDKINSNFSFHTALSEPDLTDDWNGETGFIHEVLFQNYLKDHKDLKNIEFYLCGPPALIDAANKKLEDLGVSKEMIAYDEF